MKERAQVHGVYMGTRKSCSQGTKIKHIKKKSTYRERAKS